MAEGWEDRQDRKLKRAVNRSFEAISDSTSFGRRREMTAREKPHWSAETARKNTVGRPLPYPSAARRPLGRVPLSPRVSFLRSSSPFDRSFPRRLRPRGVKETHDFVPAGIQTALRSSSREGTRAIRFSEEIPNRQVGEDRCPLTIRDNDAAYRPLYRCCASRRINYSYTTDLTIKPGK